MEQEPYRTLRRPTPRGISYYTVFLQHGYKDQVWRRV